MVGPLLALAVMCTGVVALEAIAPQVDPDEIAAMRIDGLPALAVDDAPQCTRDGLDDTVAEELRDRLVPGGRVTSTQVVRCPVAWDGIEVTFAGEAVGEVLPRRGGAWVQVNDDEYALGTGPLTGHRERSGSNTGLAVWLPDGLHERIEAVGRPGVRGDVVLVTGQLLRADPADGGGTTIRARDLEVVAGSVQVDEPLHVDQLVAAVVLTGVACIALAWSRARRRR